MTLATAFTDYTNPIVLEDIAPDGRIGLCALSTDYCLEQDIRRMIPDTVEVFTNRVAYRNPMTLENLRAMAGDIERTAAGILPGQGFDVAVYGCTSGTSAIGYERIVDLIQRSNPGVPVTTPLHAIIEALAALNAKRISVLTPYDREINEDMVRVMGEKGVDVINLTGLGFEVDIDVTKVPLDTIVSLAKETCDPGADAMFISCTNFRASLVIEALEAELNIPVVSSNQAIAWHSLKLLNCDKKVTGFGRLFDC